MLFFILIKRHKSDFFLWIFLEISTNQKIRKIIYYLADFSLISLARMLFTIAN